MTHFGAQLTVVTSNASFLNCKSIDVSSGYHISFSIVVLVGVGVGNVVLRAVLDLSDSSLNILSDN